MTVTTCLWGLYLGRHCSFYCSFHLSFYSLYAGLFMSSLEQDETPSLSPIDHDLAFLSNILLECLLVCRGVICSESPDLYKALRSALVLAIMLSNIDEPDLCSEHSTYFSASSHDLLRPKRPRRPRRPRRRPLLSYRPWPRYRYTDDIDYSRSDLFEDGDSVTSDCSFYESRLSRTYISESLPSLDMVRPRKWLSSILDLVFLDVFKKKNKGRRRKKDKKPSRERPSRAVVVDPPENPGEEDFRRARRTTTTRYMLPRMDLDPISEQRRNCRPRDVRARTPEARTPPAYRYRREKSIVTERKPFRRGRRTSPDRTLEVPKTNSLRDPKSYWAQQVDRESVRAFKETTTSRTTRVERPTTGASTSAGGKQRALETIMPKRGGYTRPRDGPESITVEHRAPRPRARSPMPHFPESRKVEERAPRVEFDERAPRTQPRIIQYGIGGLSNSGASVLTRARSRQDDIRVQDGTWVEIEKNRNTRRVGERTSRLYGSGPSR